VPGVTSGLGRSGPWLQNDHLRIDIRLDDGSLSLLAVQSGFRPLERAHAFVETTDGAVVGFAGCDYDMRPFEDRLGAGRTLVIHARVSGVRLTREVTLYDAHPFVVTRVTVTNERAEPAALARIHVFTTPESGRGRLRFDAPPADLRVYRHGWQSWSPTMTLAGNVMDLRSAPTILAPEPPESEPGRFASDDVGVLHDPDAARSLLAGGISARDFLTQVVINVPRRHVDARCLADGMSLAPGETVASERVLVDIVGTPQEQLERYGAALAAEMQARAPLRTPSGWCSWYYFYTQVTEDDVIRNLRALESLRRDLPIDTVQIDDGYQADIGDWLTVNEKFPHGMKWLADQIRGAGYTPGIWLAPFLLAESSNTYAGHPDWVVRDSHGEPVTAQHNWNRRNFGLDGSHPMARAWLTGLFREITQGWGYDYLKIDFLFAAAIAGRRHDADTTRLRAYRDALAAVREGAGDERFILGCGALMAPSVGLFDGNRIGPDTAPFWRFLTREERAAERPRPRGPDDELSAESSTRNVLNRWWMHGRLWANDPDCLMVRDTRTKLNEAEVRTAASVIGLSGGMTLISDDLPLLSPERIRMASMFVPPLPQSARPLSLTADMPERFDYVDDRPFDQVTLAGVFNFSDDPATRTLALPHGDWHVFNIWDREYEGVRSGLLALGDVEPHGCRVLALRPALGHPQLVGTDAHVGAGLVDVVAAAWDPGASLLTLRLAAEGRPGRSLWVYAAGQRPRSARLNQAPVPLTPASNGSWRIDVTVDRESTLTVEFDPLTG